MVITNFIYTIFNVCDLLRSSSRSNTKYTRQINTMMKTEMSRVEVKQKTLTKTDRIYI